MKDGTDCDFQDKKRYWLGESMAIKFVDEVDIPERKRETLEIYKSEKKMTLVTLFIRPTPPKGETFVYIALFRHIQKGIGLFVELDDYDEDKPIRVPDIWFGH